MMLFRIRLLRFLCSFLLPRDVWVGNHFGVYSQKYNIVFGRLDSRGVIQGVTDADIVSRKRVEH